MSPPYPTGRGCGGGDRLPEADLVGYERTARVRYRDTIMLTDTNELTKREADRNRETDTGIEIDTLSTVEEMLVKIYEMLRLALKLMTLSEPCSVFVTSGRARETET